MNGLFRLKEVWMRAGSRCLLNLQVLLAKAYLDLPAKMIKEAETWRDRQLTYDTNLLLFALPQTQSLLWYFN